MMTKHGWNRGNGLGAALDGDSEFGIKVKRKYSKTGLGDEPGKELMNEWWHKVYDKASENISSKKPTNNDLSSVMKKPLAFKTAKLKNGYTFVPVQFVKRETLNNNDFIEETKPIETVKIDDT